MKVENPVAVKIQVAQDRLVVLRIQQAEKINPEVTAAKIRATEERLVHLQALNEPKRGPGRPKKNADE